MPNSWNEILSARAGSIVVNKVDTYSLEFYAVTSVDDNTIIDILYQDEDDVTSDYIMDPASKVPKGSVITPRDINKPFTSIAISGGAVCLTLK